jgi:hypothetical protein
MSSDVRAPAVAPVSGAASAARERVRLWVATQAWVLGAALAVVVVGMAYSLWWGPVVRHIDAWSTPSDLWGTMRAAHVIGWGGEGILYQSSTNLVTFPGIAVVLAPVAIVCGALGLTEGFPIALAHPTAWVLVGPAEMVLGALLLFPLDAMARRLGVAGRRRVVLVWLEAALVWPVVALWGHPEDPLALALGIYGLMAAFDRRWRRCAGFFAAAIVLQPLTVLVLPIAFVYLPRRRWLPMAGIAAFPSAMLLVAPLAYAWKTTVHALVDQPNYPSIDHATPWLALAPVLQPAREFGGGLVLRHTTGGLTFTTAPGRLVEVVAGGPGRLIAIGCAVALAVVVARARPSEPTVLWLAALALCLRCVFESVLDPYYFVPGLAVALVLAARTSGRRLGAATLCAAACTYWSYRHVGQWEYYLPVTVLLLGAWALGRPDGPARWTPSRNGRGGRGSTDGVPSRARAGTSGPLPEGSAPQLVER